MFVTGRTTYRALKDASIHFPYLSDYCSPEVQETGLLHVGQHLDQTSGSQPGGWDPLGCPELIFWGVVFISIAVFVQH